MKKTPKISIVTPSYNQGRFLEKTISSVLDQNYPNLEYIIIDGGSTDNSIDIIKKYERNLAYWISEPDSGQYNAINKGFCRSTGDIMAWINSDDMYCPWALGVVAGIFGQLKDIDWLTTLFPLTFNAKDQAISCGVSPGYNKEMFYEGRYCGLYPDRQIHYIQQESTFWSRKLWEMSGGALDENFALAADFDLWARFYEKANLYALAAPLAGFREHDSQRSHDIRGYLDECRVILKRYEHTVKPVYPRMVMSHFKLNKFPILNRYLIKKYGYDTNVVSPVKSTMDTLWEISSHKFFL